jgi:hypothetical protein
MSSESLRGISRLFGDCNRSFHIAGLPLASLPSHPPQSDCGSTQNSGKGDQPRRKVCDGIASCLFPKPVIFILLCGSFAGCGIVAIAWAIIEGQHNKNPNRKCD